MTSCPLAPVARLAPIATPEAAAAAEDATDQREDVDEARSLRVMPLGDSITEGAMVPGGYRTELWRLSTLEGVLLEYVGTRQNGPVTLPHRRHEGHPGFRIEGIEASVDKWLAEETPDVVLLMIGTNDMLADDRRATAPDRLGKLLDRIVEHAPSAEVLVASVPPLGPKFGKQVDVFDSALPAIVSARAAAGKHVRFVDVRSTFTAKDLLDGIHPSARGYEKIARAWLPALRAAAASRKP